MEIATLDRKRPDLFDLGFNAARLGSDEGNESTFDGGHRWWLCGVGAAMACGLHALRPFAKRSSSAVRALLYRLIFMDAFSGFMPPDDQPVSSTWLWPPLAGLLYCREKDHALSVVC
jgi:hypothetical protein